VLTVTVVEPAAMVTDPADAAEHEPLEL